eukprot:152117_1
MSEGHRKDRSRSRSPSRSNRKLRTSSKSSKGRHHKHRAHTRKKSNRSRSRSRDRSCSISSSSLSRSRSRSREHSKRKKRKKSKHKKSKKRKRSPSPSDSDYSSDSDTSYSSSSSSVSYEKKRKKKKKDKKRRKKSSKKHKKSSKKKRKKSKKKRDKTLLDGNMSIYKPSEYREGMHGFISTNDYYNKMPEFTSWLVDIHGVCVDNLVKRDEKKWFAKFCDDWNTSTMADDKYYDLDKWNKANGGDESVMATMHMSDEQKLNLRKKEQRQKDQDRRYSARVQEMKRQLIQLKSNNKRGFQSLNDQYIPKKETFESLAAKRQAKKVEDRFKRFGKYDTNYTLD